MHNKAVKKRVCQGNGVFLQRVNCADRLLYYLVELSPDHFVGELFGVLLDEPIEDEPVVYFANKPATPALQDSLGLFLGNLQVEFLMLAYCHVGRFNRKSANVKNQELLKELLAQLSFLILWST